MARPQGTSKMLLCCNPVTLPSWGLSFPRCPKAFLLSVVHAHVGRVIEWRLGCVGSGQTSRQPWFVSQIHAVPQRCLAWECCCSPKEEYQPASPHRKGLPQVLQCPDAHGAPLCSFLFSLGELQLQWRTIWGTWPLSERHLLVLLALAPAWLCLWCERCPR